MKHDTLERWLRRRKTAQALGQRARLVLTAAEGRSNGEIVRLLRVTPQTVSKWRGHFLHHRGVHRSTRELETAIYRYIERQNELPTPFIWTKTADQILASLARFCQRISDSGH